MVENATSHFWAPIIVTGVAGLSIGSLPSLVGEHPTTNTTFDASASHSSTPSASSPLLPTPATATSPPSVTPDHEEGVPLPQSPVHGNLGKNYGAPSEDPQKWRNVTLSVSTGCNLLSQPVKIANYLKPLASEKDCEIFRHSRESAC